MSILNRLWQYVQTHGYPRACFSPLAPEGRTSRRRRERGRGAPRAVEQMEPRLLLTTLFGATPTNPLLVARAYGEVFQYTDARQKLITATISGNTIAELISSVQDAYTGQLLFADIGGKIVSSPIGRTGTIIGNGCVPVTLNEGGGAPTNITDPLGAVGIGLNVTLAALATYNGATIMNPGGAFGNLNAGDTFAFNVYSPAGNIANTSPAVPNVVIQMIKLNPKTGATLSVLHLENLLEQYTVTMPGAAGAPPVSVGQTTAVSAITAAAFNPVDGLLYFVGKGEAIDPVTNKADTLSVLYAYDFSTGTLVGQTLNQPSHVAGSFNNTKGDITIKSIAFNPTDGSLWAVQADAAGATTLINMPFTTYAGSTTNIFATHPVMEGYGTKATAATKLTGLAFAPALPGDTGQFVFAVQDDGASSRLLRVQIDAIPGQNGSLPATDWGDLTDLYDTAEKAPFRGQDIQGLTWDSQAINPFTGELGSFLATDVTRDDLLFVDRRLRISQGDVYSVYTPQADINSAIAFRGPTLYTGNIGAFHPVGSPANTGVAFLGALGDVAVGNGFVGNVPLEEYALTTGIGIRPSLYTTDSGTTAAPSDTFYSGFTVGRSLEKLLNPAASMFDQLLGQTFTSIHGLSISRDGTIAAVDTDQIGPTGLAIAGDELGFIDPLTGALTGEPMAITYNNGTTVSLAGIQGLAYGDPTSSGTDTLYAVYNIDLGLDAGLLPTLGIIDPATGAFTPVGVQMTGLGALPRIKALAFSPEQNLYVIVDPDSSDASNASTIVRINPATGAAGAASGTLRDGNANVLNVGSAVFDAAGDLIVQDLASGRLLSANLVTGRSTAVSAAGTVNPTVGAITMDPATGKFFAVDNVTGQTRGATNALVNSSIYMSIADFNQATTDATNFGRFSFDGVVTGKVFVSGSINQFYSGWLITGDPTNAQIVPGDAVSGLYSVRQFNASMDMSIDNFHAEGDIRNVLTLTGAGTVTGTGYWSGLDITAGGKIGNVDTLGTFRGRTAANDGDLIPNLTDVSVNPDVANINTQQEIATYQLGQLNGDAAKELNGDPNPLFDQGYVVDPASNGVNPFGNLTFDTATYLGTIRNAVAGQPDVIHLQGTVQGWQGGGVGPNQVDYFGFSLTAGQTVYVQVKPIATMVQQYDALGHAVRDGLGNLVMVESFGFPPNFGVFDPDGRLIATDYSDMDSLQVQSQVIKITADRPGVYRVAVGLPGNTGFFGPAVNNLTSVSIPDEIPYNLTIAGVGDMAIGGVVSKGSTFLDGNGRVGVQAQIGDIGAIVAGAAIDGQSSAFFAFDVEPLVGNLRAMVGGTVTSTVPGQAGPALDIPLGKVGLLRATAGGMDAEFVDPNTFRPAPAGREIQVVDATGAVGGSFYTNMGMGTIRGATMGSPIFDVDFDNTGSDGIIDLIAVSGDLGSIMTGGPRIVTHLGGNVRFMQVGGYTYQDNFYANSQTQGTLGQIIHTAGVPVTQIDDSGAIMTLMGTAMANPLAGQVNLDGTIQPATIAGQLTTLTYGIEGSGGSVLINVTSTSGLTVSINPSGLGRSGEIGQVTTSGAGIPIVVTNGVPAIGPATGAAGVGGAAAAVAVSNDVTINSSGGAKVDVLNIKGGTLDNITNNTGGDIVNVTATEDIGNLTNHGNIGWTAGSWGEAVNPIAVVSGVYPFVDQRTGITATNIGTITSDKSIGNVIASGVIGTVIANRDGVHDPSTPNTLEGIVGPIVANGTATITPPVNSTKVIPPVSIMSVKIGEGIAPSGNGSMSQAGLYANGEIVAVTGTNADIRGNIVSTSPVGIGSITLTNGSIINANIEVPTTFALSGELNITQGTLPSDPTNTLENPVYAINKVTINGNGGIIGTVFVGANLGTFTVASTGFGILDSGFAMLGDGVLAGISAGGYGVRDVFIVGGASTGYIKATGNGTLVNPTAYSAGVRLSEKMAFDSSTGRQPNRLTDLDVFIDGSQFTTGIMLYGTWRNPLEFSTGTTVLPFSPASPGLHVTGVIEGVATAGSQNLGSVVAYNIADGITSAGNPTMSSFDYANSTGTFTVANKVTHVRVVTGTIKSVTIGSDATDFDLEVAGKVGPIIIKGSFLKSVPTATSMLMAKGPSGDIASIAVAGDFSGDLTVEGRIGTINIGTAGVNAPGTGDFTGNIVIQGNRPGLPTVLDMLKLFGAIDGGSIVITGNVGTIDVAKDLMNLTQDLIIRGNLANLKVGSDPKKNAASVLGSHVTVDGNLAAATISGAINSAGGLLVKGNIGTVGVAADAFTVGNVMSGMVEARGTIGTLTVKGGGIDGQVVGGRGITSLTDTGGSLAATGAISSSLGNLGTITFTNGSVNGAISAPNGAITSIKVTGAGNGLGATAQIQARSLSTLTIPGDIAGGASIDIANKLGSVTVGGSIGAGTTIAVGSLGTLKTTLDELANISTGLGSTITTLTAGRDFGGQSSFDNPVSVTVNRNMIAGSVLAAGTTLNMLSVKGDLAGDVFADKGVTNITAATVTNAVITSGFGITGIKVTGAVNNSLVQAGLGRGNDGLFGTNDLGEAPRMADLTSFTAGSLTNSIIAAGGNVGTFRTTGLATNSSVSSGLVLAGTGIAGVVADGTPLASTGALNAARMGATLLHGNFTSATVGTLVGGLVGSALTAGVSPGADGAFGTADDNVNTSVTGGVSAFKTVKAVRDGASFILANAPGGAIVKNYTTGATAGTSITATNPLTGVVLGVATPLAPAIITIGPNSFTVTITGAPTATVTVITDVSATGTVPSLLIDGGGVVTAVKVTVTGTLPLGRVIATDNTIVSSFITTDSLLGDGLANTPDLWIDSDMTSLTLGNLPNDATWSGQIGGNVGTMIVNQQGPGRLTIGGKVTTLTVNSSVGNPLYNQLGQIAVPITQLATNAGGTTYAYANGGVFPINVTTGVAGAPVTVQTIFTNQAANLTALNFSSAGTLYGIATINNQSPTVQIGKISSTGDSLHGMAVDAAGNIFAINTTFDSGLGQTVDQLVELAPATGTMTVIGTLRDAFNNYFNNNVLALTFDNNGTLLALVNDRDGNGSLNTPTDGVALVKIATTIDPGTVKFVRVSNPGTVQSASAQRGVILAGATTDGFTGFVTDSAGNIFVIERVGSTDQLDQLTLTLGNGICTAVEVTAVGIVRVDGGATNTNIIGMGYDETGHLIALNANGVTRELIGIDTNTPGNSVRITAAGLIAGNLAGFAFGTSGTNFASFGYTTDAVNGGTFFTNPGVVSTLGTVDITTGKFTQFLALAQDTQGTPLTGTAVGLAVDSGGSGNIFVVTSQHELLEYGPADGSLIGTGPIGQIRDSLTGDILNVTDINFDTTGRLVGLNAGFNRLVGINLTTTTIGGQNFALASGLTEMGLVDASDLSAITVDPTSGQFIAYSNSYGGFVVFRGTTESSLGGIVASTLGTVNLPGAGYRGRIEATGVGTGASITTINATGAGTFRGDIVTEGSIGMFKRTGGDFGGAVLSGGNLATATITGGSITPSGIITTDYTLGSFKLTGSLGGTVFAGLATTLTVTGSALAGSLLDVNTQAGNVSITGGAAGQVTLGSATSLKVGGLLGATATIDVLGDAGTVTLSGGTAAGSSVIVGNNLTTLTVGGTHSGLIATRHNAGTVTFANLNAGLAAFGGDVSSLSVKGATLDSLISAGTWIGNDGQYNTADDVIYGGTITKASFTGTFTDSMIAAGVLPRQGTAAGPANNIPASNNSFTGRPTAANIADVDSAEAGGIAISRIGTLTFTAPVVSTNFGGIGLFSAAVTADGFGKVTAKGDLTQRVLSNPIGAPAVATQSVTTGGITVTTKLVTRLSTTKIRVVFAKPLDTATLDALTVQVTDGTLPAKPYLTATFSYFTQVASDGTTQGVLDITDLNAFGNSAATTHRTVILTGGIAASAITDRASFRSSLLDFNQDGIPDAGGNPFAGPLVSGSFVTA